MTSPLKMHSAAQPHASQALALRDEDRERMARLDGPVHGWFELTYANYQVLHRSLMQSMPIEWQERMVAALEEFREAYSHLDHPWNYRVQLVDESGRFTRDSIPHYDRGRTFVPPKGDENLEWKR